MANNAVEQIGNAIDRLSPKQLQELYVWLDQHHPQPIDERLGVDLANGNMDGAIFRALDDESKGLTQPL